MRRTLFYDRTTGELLHSHYEVRAVEVDAPELARLSEPQAVELDADMAELVSRGLDPGRLGSLVTTVAPQSSRRTERSVNVTTGRLGSRRLELVSDRTTDEDG